MRTHTPPHTHQARILRFADADTVVVLIEGMWGIWSERYLRLLNIEAHELDGPQAETAKAHRDELNRLLGNRTCLVHLTSHGHDKYGRLRGQITIGESDLATTLVAKGFAWHCTPRDSAASHARTAAALAIAGASAAGCYYARDAAQVIVVNQRPQDGHTNSTAPGTITVSASPRQSATPPSHIVWWTLGGLALAALIAAIIWLVHNRGKLAGMVATIATKL